MVVGCHLSFSKGYLAMGKNALEIGANCFQFFSRNPRGSTAREFNISDAQDLAELMSKNNFGAPLAHAPYTLNPCSADEGLRDFALRSMKDDITRLAPFENALYNFHPGSHVGQGVECGIELTANMLREIYKDSFSVEILIETMSGKGSEIGATFEEIAKIIELADGKPSVCLDTCHIYSAGYDIVNNLNGVLEDFDKIIGISKLKAIHLNDSLTPFNSHKDRHAKLGEGSIGLDAIAKIVVHPQLKNLPFYLETPNDDAGYATEIATLRKIAE